MGSPEQVGCSRPQPADAGAVLDFYPQALDLIVAVPHTQLLAIDPIPITEGNSATLLPCLSLLKSLQTSIREFQSLHDSNQVALFPVAPRFPAPPVSFPCCMHCHRGTSARLLASLPSRRTPPQCLQDKSGLSLPPPRLTAFPRSSLSPGATPSPPRPA